MRAPAPTPGSAPAQVTQLTTFFCCRSDVVFVDTVRGHRNSFTAADAEPYIMSINNSELKLPCWFSVTMGLTSTFVGMYCKYVVPVLELQETGNVQTFADFRPCREEVFLSIMPPESATDLIFFWCSLVYVSLNMTSSSSVSGVPDQPAVPVSGLVVPVYDVICLRLRSAGSAGSTCVRPPRSCV